MNKHEHLIDIMKKINSSINLRGLLNIIIDSAKTLINSEGASFIIYDKQCDDLVFDLVLSDKGEILQGKRIKIGEGIAGIVAQEKKPQIINDVRNSDSFSPIMDELSGFVTKNICAVPITIQDTLLGVIEVVNSKNEGGFTEEDIKMLQYLSDATAIAINKHELLSSLKNRVAELTCIYEISQSIYFTFDIDSLLKRILNAVNRVIKAEKCSFVILDDNSNRVKHFVSTTGEHHHIDLENSLMTHVIKTGDPLLVFNAEKDFTFSSTTGDGKKYQSNSFICVPMKLRDRIIGVLNVTDKPKGITFDSFDLRVLSTVANQVAETYDNILHEKKSIENDKLQKELEIASNIQKMFLSPIPQSTKYEIGAFTIAASIVGGDFYECSVLNENLLALSMGDVSGKGVPAALYMNGIRNSIRYEAFHYSNPKQMVETINQWAYNESKNGMFCTMAQTYIDHEKNSITFYSAGHNDQLFYQKRDDIFISINGKGKPLGINAKEIFEPIELFYHSGDMLILFTDGLIDEFADNIYTEESLIHLIQENNEKSAKEITSIVKENISQASAQGLQLDDSTLLIIKFL